MRLQPCLDKNTRLTDAQKKQIRADVKDLVSQGLNPQDAATNVAYSYFNPLKEEQQRVTTRIRAYYKDLVNRAEAAGKPVYKEPKKGPEPSLQMPRQPGLPGFMNPVLRDILTMKIVPTRDDLLMRLSADEFNAINTVMGFPTTGNRVKKVDRFMELYDLRKKLQDYATTFDGATAYAKAYKKDELKSQAKTAKIWSSGNKVQLAGALLGWRDRTRRKGLTTLIEEFEKAGMADRAEPFRKALATPLGRIGQVPEGRLDDWKEDILSDYAKESRELADWVQKKLENQQVIRWQDLFKQADKAYGGTQASGDYTPKDAYDAMELGVNRYILANISFIEPSGARKAPEVLIQDLKRIGDLLPTQTKRTQEMEEFQQFSTPPFLAFAANHVANIQTGDVYMEPSAGIGGLAIFGKMSNASRILVNELSSRRIDLLRILDFDGYFNEDAAQLDNVLRDDIKPTVIVMNPPFSSTAGRLKRNMTTYGAKHVEQALKRLEPGGRLVAIVGRGMEPTAPTFKKWWRDIGRTYSVRANIGISGQEYRKYGTTFDNRLLIIDKVDPRQYKPIVAEVEKVDEIPKLLEKVRDDRPEIPKPGQEREPEPLQPERPEAVTPAEGPGEPGEPVQPTTADLAPGEREAEAAGPPDRGLPEQPAEPQPQPSDEVAPAERPSAPGRPTEPGPGAPGGTALRPPGERGRIPTEGPVDLSIDELADLIDEVSAEEGLEVGARPAAEAPSAPTKPKPTKAKPKGPKESDFDDLADIIDGIEVKEAQAPYGNLQYPEIYQKAKPILERTWNDFIASGQTNPKEWVRLVLTGLNRRNVNPDIAKNWILYFYANDRPAAPEPTREERKALAIEKAQRKYKKIRASVYERYQPIVQIPGAKVHPTTLDESVALADTQPPAPTYEPTLPKEMIESGKVSDAQLEAVVYAGQAHDQVLPNGERKGFFAGHGTGVGKGRIIASIILDNWNKGRKKAVWISETGKLAKDARRDLGYDTERKSESGIGWKEGYEKLFTMGPKHKLGTPGSKFPQKDGILFTTYGTLRSNWNKINASKPESFQNMRVRINQIVDWLGPDFDGVIAFDESHNMANATEQQTGRGRKKAANQALAGIMLQNRLPNARIVYVSATGATEVSNFAYAERLGLWGEGTAFGRKQGFIDAIQSAGLAGMELVARDMKSMGLYQAPALSYDGVNYDRITHKLDDTQRAKYDELAGAWQVVLRNINEALGITGAEDSGQAKRNIWSQFWGGHQRFFNQVITTMQMGSAINHIEDQLKEGNSIVLQLVNHGGAQLERVTAAREEGQELEDLDFTPRQALMSYIENSFPVQQYETYTDEDGNEGVRPVYDSEGNPVLNREAVRMREELLGKIGAISIPNSPLDLILEHFGTENVAEVTGRKRRVVMDRETGKLKEEKWSDAKANADAEAFMQDEKRILVFSEKGGTGRSYHADLDTDNHRKRIHYLVQPGWRADKAIQGLGRTHRSNQAQPPEYFLITTDLNAQKRFISSIARRLDQLGALTKGQRQTGSQGIFQARDNLESEYARIALYQYYKDIVAGEAGITADEFKNQTAMELRTEDGDLRADLPPPQKFMNRLLSMTIADQNKVFDEWSDRIDNVIDAAAAAGTLDVGIETITGLSINKAEEKVVNVQEETGAETRYIKLEVEQPSKRIAWEDVVADQFYQNKTSGKIWAASPIRTGTDSSGNVYEYRTLTSVAGSMQRQRMADLFTDDAEAAKFVEIKDEAQARQLWEDQYQKTSPTTKRDIHIMTGALLPIWDRLKGAATVYRMETDVGERILGRVIHQNKIEEVLQNLGVDVDPIDLTGDEISKRILDDHAKVRLANGWRMKRVNVSGDERIELIGPDYDHWNELKNAGVIFEKIQHKTRYFVPTGARAGSTIEALTKHRPVRHVEMPYAGPTLKDTALSEPRDLLDKFGKGKQVQLQLFSGNQLNIFTDIPETEPAAPAPSPLVGGPRRAPMRTTVKPMPGPARNIELRSTGDISHYGTKVRNIQEVGGLLSFIQDHAEETAWTVAVDKDSNILQIHKLSKGHKSAAMVPIVETGGTFLREPDARKLYFVHNHPSDSTEPSAEDRAIVQNIVNIGRLRGIEVIPVILTREKIGTWDTDTGHIAEMDITDELKRRVAGNLNTKIPISERFVNPLKRTIGMPQINNSQQAVKHIAENYGGKQGFLFLDTKNRDIGFMPWVTGKPRSRTTEALISELERLNASAFVINWTEPVSTSGDVEMHASRLKYVKDLLIAVKKDGLNVSFHDVIINNVSLGDQGILIGIANSINNSSPKHLANLVGDDILFSRKVAPPLNPLSADQVKGTVQPILEKMATRPDVVVLNTQTDLPPGVREYLRESGGDGDIIMAAVYDGKIYMVAENIGNTKEAVRALLHEAIGHLGIRGLLGDNVNKTLDSVWIAKQDEVRNIAREYGYNLRTVDGRRAAAEEWLARQAETNPRSTWIDRLVTRIRAWLRKINPKLLLNDAEIRTLISKARQYVETGQKATVFPPIAFDRIPEHADRWYSHMETYIGEKLPNSGTGSSYMEFLKNAVRGGKIKSEELEWSGIMEWLAEEPPGQKIPKDSVMEYLAVNNIKLEELIKQELPARRMENLEAEPLTWILIDPENENMGLEASFENPYTLEYLSATIIPDGQGKFELEIEGESYGEYDSFDDAADYAQAEFDQLLSTWEGIAGTQMPEHIEFSIRPQDVSVEWDTYYGDAITGSFEYADFGMLQYLIAPHIDGETWVLKNDEGDTIQDQLGSREEAEQAALNAYIEWAEGVYRDQQRTTPLTVYGPMSQQGQKLNVAGGKLYKEMLLMLPLEFSRGRTEGYVFEEGWSYDPIADFDVETVYTISDVPGRKDVKWEIDQEGDNFAIQERRGGPGDLIVSNYAYTAETIDEAKEHIEEVLVPAWHQETDEMESGVFVSTHWPGHSNILVHARFDERIGRDGEKILFLQEVQSDWHAKGRREGYGFKRGVPDAPFKKSWRMLAIKRMVRYAAENDFDRIAWTTGEMQADRYDMSQYVNMIEVTPRTDARTGEETREVSIITRQGVQSSIDLGVDNAGVIDNSTEAGLKGRKLEDVVGKELADKIMASNDQTLEGLKLKVGGTALRQLYDKILPNEINKFFNKKAWGRAKVEPTTITVGSEFEEGRAVGPKDLEVMSLPITSTMKSKALYQGMPMFMRRRKNYGDYDIMSRLPEEVRDRFAKARGVPKTPWKERAKERIQYLRSLRWHFPGLSRLQDVTQAAQLADILRQHQEVPETSKDQAVRAITRFTKPLTQAEYEIFRTHVILSDMMRDVESGLLDDQNLKETETLPFGFRDLKELRTTWMVFDQLADENPKVRKAIQDRRKMINGMVRQMVKFKILKKEVLKHKDYFHHQVLAFWAGNKMRTTGTSSADVRTHWRPWMAARTGSMQDYNTEYVEAEFAALAQQMAQIETAKTLEKIKRKADIFKTLKTAAKFENYNRFYQKEADRLSKIFGQDITAAQVAADKDMDPLFGFRQNIAMASSNLRRMAAKDKLEVDSEWDDVVDALAEEYEISKMADEEYSGLRDTPEISDARYFQFLSYLIEKKKPGAMWAATTFKAIKGRDRLIKNVLADDFVTFRQLIPENYTTWKPESNKGWFWANSVADDIIQKVIAGEKVLEDRDVRQVLAKGQELNWVIPEGLAETLDNFRRYPEPNSLGRVADWALRAWKQWILINPRRWLKYNINNMSGDLDIALAYAPGIATPNKMRKALRDLMKWHKRKELPDNIQAELDNARRKGVIGSGFAVQEVEDVLNLMSMDKWVREVLLGEKPNVAMRYWEKLKGSTVIRENILRLAAYRWFRRALQDGKLVYGASKRAEIDAIKDLDDKAAKLARELIGDYGNISQAGQYIRRRLIPFYSWLEINLPRYVYMMRNLRSEDRHHDAAKVRARMAGIVSKRTLTGAGKLAIKANILMGAVLLWNLLAHRDEWEELGEAKRRQMHLIIGRNEDGTIQTIRFQGALSDALAWFGLEDWPADIADIKNKKGSVQEKIADVPKAAATKLIHGVRPEPKILFETLTKTQTYPDPFSPRPIRDTLGHVLRTFSLDSIYRMASGKPGRGRTMAEHFLNDLKTILVYDSDPGEQAYYDVRKYVFDWLGDQGIERPSGKPTNRSNALYYYRQALKYGDLDAAKRYLMKYYDLGGSPRSLRTSIKRAHPLGSLAMKHRFKFRQSLSPEQQKKLEIALEWYNRVYRKEDLSLRMEVAKERYGAR